MQISREVQTNDMYSVSLSTAPEGVSKVVLQNASTLLVFCSPTNRVMWVMTANLSTGAESSTFTYLGSGNPDKNGAAAYLSLVPQHSSSVVEYVLIGQSYK